MRIFALACGVLMAGAAQAAQPAAHNTPDDIICKLSGSCEGSQADSNQQIKVGDERAFSLARPGAVKADTSVPTQMRTATPTATAPRIAMKPVARHAAAKPQPATSSGGLDMLVTFASGSADLTEQGKAEARAFAEAMRAPALAAMKFKVDGHTDAVGNRDYNLDLSKRRAQSVADYLVSLGIERGRVEPEGFGFDKPRPGTTPKDAINRRVELSRAN